MRYQTFVGLVVAVAAMFLVGAEPGDRTERGADFPLFAKDDVIFNGKDLTGWEADSKDWSVEDGEIVGKAGDKHPYSYLTTTKAVKDFRLTLMMKLTPNEANSGIQVRSVRIGKNEMKGPQCDAGKGWWGHVYEEHARGLLTKESGEKWLKPNEWNQYEIVFVGNRLMTAINGHLCADLDDAQLAKQGVIGLQLHSGDAQEVRFKDLKLEVDPAFELKTVVGKE